MMADRILTLICLLVLMRFERLEAFSYHETMSVTRKSSSDETHDYVLGPEFHGNEKFAYAKVKTLQSRPAAIEVSFEVYDKSSSIAKKSVKKFVADIGSRAINVTAMKLGPSALLSITETQNNNESKAMLVQWNEFGYPDPSLYLPVEHILVSNACDFGVFANDGSLCPTLSNGKCWIQLEDRQSPKRREFFHENLIWSSMHIDYAKYDKLFIRGFDAHGSYKFLECAGTTYKPSGCCQLLLLPSADQSIDAHPLDRGLCFVERAGVDKSVKCLKFDKQQRAFDRTVGYDEPMSVLDVEDFTDDQEILIVASNIACQASNCFNIVLSKIPYDVYDGITHRYLALECSDNEKLFKVSLTKYKYLNAITIEYICESDVEFIFKSATVNDD